MVATGNGKMGAALAGDMAAEDRAVSDLALREKNRFWFEKPAKRFCVYFCVFVTAEILTGITLHWIFHII